MTTIYDIAKRLAIHPSTVSRALTGKHWVREELKQRILATARELDYQPNSLARSLISKQSHSIGLVLPDITNPFFPALARGVEDVANANGYNVILCNTDENMLKEESYVELLRSKQVDGVVYVATKSSSEHVGLLTAVDVPVVLADRQLSTASELDSVVVDNEDGARRAMTHLLRAGHRQIALIAAPHTITSASDKMRGCMSALSDYDLELPSDAVVAVRDYVWEAGYRATEKLMRERMRPTAILAWNDILAVGAMAAVWDCGLSVPDEVAVVGYDDSVFAQVSRPQLTTVRQPTYEMGREACRILLKRSASRDRPVEHVVLKATLVVRGSSLESTDGAQHRRRPVTT